MGIENPVHILFIALVALVVLGPKRLPEVARALGQGIREFRESINTPPDQQIVHQPPPGPPMGATQTQAVYEPVAAPPVAPSPPLDATATVVPQPVASQPPPAQPAAPASTPASAPVGAPEPFAAPEQGQPAGG
jgi:TatA/E family protein of Tat protein translocase